MSKSRILNLLLTVLLSAPIYGAKKSVQKEVSCVPNRAPLTEKTYMALPLGNIQADGWIAEQLNRMRSGLTGHLDEI